MNNYKNALILSASVVLPAMTAPSFAAQQFDDLLTLDLAELSQIKVVTATKQAQAVGQVPGTVRVVTAETIRKRGYQNLQQALADLPGVQLRDIQGFNSYLFMRGATSQNNLILLLVDGVQINELNSGGFYLGNQFNLLNVKQIEVVYGPSSSLYGTNAISGVINVITYAPDDTLAQSSKVHVTAGSFNTKQVSVRTGDYDAEKKEGFTLAAQWNDTDRAELGGAAGDYNWTTDMENFQRNVTLEGKYRYQDLEIGLIHQDQRSSRTTNYNTVSDGYLDKGSEWHIHFTNFWAKHQYDLNKQLQLNSQLYYRNATVADDTIGYINNADGQAAYYRPNSLWGIEEKLDYRVNPSLFLTLGVVHEEERVASKFGRENSGDVNLAPVTPVEPAPLNNALTSLYLQGQYQFNQNWQLTAGARHEESSYYGSYNSPRMALVFTQPNYTWKLGYTEAFRAPKPWDFNNGVSNLKPEAMKSVETSLTYMVGSNLQVDVALYDNAITNKLAKNDSGLWANQGGLYVQGSELSLAYQRDKLGLDVSYSFNDSKDQDGVKTDEIAEHMLGFGANYQWSSTLASDVRAHYLGERPNPNVIAATGESKVAAAWVLDATANYQYSNQLHYQLAIKNVLDTEYYHTSNRPVERYRQPQRTILFTLDYKIN